MDDQYHLYHQQESKQLGYNVANLLTYDDTTYPSTITTSDGTTPFKSHVVPDASQLLSQLSVSMPHLQSSVKFINTAIELLKVRKVTIDLDQIQENTTMDANAEQTDFIFEQLVPLSKPFYGDDTKCYLNTSDAKNFVDFLTQEDITHTITRHKLLKEINYSVTLKLDNQDFRIFSASDEFYKQADAIYDALSSLDNISYLQMVLSTQNGSTELLNTLSEFYQNSSQECKHLSAIDLCHQIIPF